MTKTLHTIYIGAMTLIVIVVTYILITDGYSYYSLPLEERFYHPRYNWFKPSGIFGQGLGVVGTILIAFGVFIYIARKRYGFLGRYIRIKYLLEFHIFLCVLGPILILFHTTFKFGGIVSIAFWSMVAVVLSGVIGRFIYIQIPRTIEGRELTIQEILSQRKEYIDHAKAHQGLSDEMVEEIFSTDLSQKWGLLTWWKNLIRLKGIRKKLKRAGLSSGEQREILSLVKKEMVLSSKVGRLEQMQNLFKYWHVIHMPFAIIMLIIVLIHIIVTVTMGYKWIF